MSIIAIILNIANIIGLVGYALILYDNIQLKNTKSIEHIDNTDYIKEHRNSNGVIKYGAIIVLVVLVFTAFKFLKEDSIETSNYNKFEIEQSNNIETDSQSVVIEDIRADYESKKIESEEVVTKMNGINRYNSLLIGYLSGYDINNIDNAKVVYELSDELLNGMYQGFKNDMSEEMFNELRDNQRIWVSNKAKSETNMQENELLKYQTLIDMTLDRCREWNDYYNK